MKQYFRGAGKDINPGIVGSISLSGACRSGLLDWWFCGCCKSTIVLAVNPWCQMLNEHEWFD